MPGSKPALLAWLRRSNIALQRNGCRFAISLSDLPPGVQRAWQLREIERAGLAAGQYDDEAHARLDEATARMRERALRKAQIACLLVASEGRLRWGETVPEAQRRFGAEGTSTAGLRRIKAAVKGADPVNFAPALLDDFDRKGAPLAAMTEEAWRFFLTTLRDAGEQYPLVAAWCDVRDVARVRGWQWPSAPTVWRRWDALSPAEKLHARLGHEQAVKRLAQPAMRDRTSILPLEWVSLDGRTKDFWAHDGEGKPLRYTFLALVDCASGFILGFELAESENARATVRLITKVCKQYGIFDRLYPDNGSAFAGPLVAGGAVRKFRNSRNRMERVKPLGICHHLGIRLHFALPGNGQAKAAERAFATLSRRIDDRPEFKGAHAGHEPGASPGAKVKPIHVDEVRAILTREVARHNAERGRRGQGMRGRSYQEVFEAGLKARTRRQAMARQLYLAGLIYTPVSVDRFGRVKLDTWTYGDPTTQEHLLPYHKSGQKILLGRNPDDFHQPTLAWNEAGELICEGIEPVQAGAYGSMDSIRVSRPNLKAARDAVAAGAEANNYLLDQEVRAALAAIPTPPGPEVPDAPVVEGNFTSSLKRRVKAGASSVESDELAELLPRGKSMITPEMRENQRRKLTGLGG